jgi:hypothetical protein
MYRYSFEIWYTEQDVTLLTHPTAVFDLPVILQSNLSVGASPEYWLIMPLLAACGTGIVRVMGLWNLRRRGSTVTIGDTATRLPNSFAASSAGIGCACNETDSFQ